MKHGIHVVCFLCCITAGFAFLSGCVTVQPFPQSARAGDTITLAVGSPDDLKQANTTVTFVPDSAPGTSINLTPNVTSIFKVYPDKTSSAWLVQAATIDSSAGHGSWLSVIALNLPSTMPVGPGKVYVSATGSRYPNGAHSIDGVAINLEILPGTGNANPLQYLPYSWSTEPLGGDLSLLKAGPQVLVRMYRAPGVGFGTSTYYGAMEIRVHVQMQDASAMPLADDDNIAVVFDDQQQHLRSRALSTWSRSGDDFLITFVSPPGSLQPYEARFSILPRPGTGVQLVGTPVLTSVKYFDIDGNPVSGPKFELVSLL